MTLPNRFIRSATWEGMAEADGSCTKRLVDKMVELVHGGVGLIITGHSYVTKIGQAGLNQLGIHDDAMIPGLKTMTQAVHDAGGAIMMQIAHAGCHAATELTGMEALGPSVIFKKDEPICREMTLKEIEDTVSAFGQAARRAKTAGFDGVQIHGAHGYCLSQFLSPFYNQRKDEYGGNLENRVRIVRAVYRSVRKAVGDDYPVIIKINSEDFLENGFTVDEMLDVAQMLEEDGIDAIELSGGTSFSKTRYLPVRPGKITKETEGFYIEAAKRYKEKINTPLILVGGIRSFDVAENIVENGIADAISMSRPLIREPNLIRLWKSGNRKSADCLSDNLCFKPAWSGKGIYCVSEVEPKA